MEGSIAMEPAVGIIPAAGNGRRLLPLRTIKELLAVGYDKAPEHEGGIRPRLVIQYALDALKAADVSEAYVIVGDNKLEIARVLSDGSEFGLALAYLHQREALGLPAALDVAFPWLHGRMTVMALPDTITYPLTSLRDILQELRSNRTADVVLGVFPTDNPEELCPVVVDDQCRLIQLFDKTKNINIRNTWGIAAWTSRFSEFMHTFLAKRPLTNGPEITLAEVFSAALGSGIEIRCRMFDEGLFFDIGKNKSLISAIRALELSPLSGR
jgi:glucose-1-phosphate thymidylyltransferase